MTITVTALRWLGREILAYAFVRVIELWSVYALLGVIDLWWLYGWHVGVTALVAFCGIAWFVLYKKRSQARQGEAMHEITSDNSFLRRVPIETYGIRSKAVDYAWLVARSDDPFRSAVPDLQGHPSSAGTYALTNLRDAKPRRSQPRPT
jgi:hypothetical protein